MVVPAPHPVGPPPVRAETTLPVRDGALVTGSTGSVPDTAVVTGAPVVPEEVRSAVAPETTIPTVPGGTIPAAASMIAVPTAVPGKPVPAEAGAAPVVPGEVSAAAARGVTGVAAAAPVAAPVGAPRAAGIATGPAHAAVTVAEGTVPPNAPARTRTAALARGAPVPVGPRSPRARARVTPPVASPTGAAVAARLTTKPPVAPIGATAVVTVPKTTAVSISRPIPTIRPRSRSIAEAARRAVAPARRTERFTILPVRRATVLTSDGVTTTPSIRTVVLTARPVSAMRP
ncbi:hypothetical protein EF879_23090 [Micromonospora sp. HM5-17]|nr:hypothetical protein EF879_23090 [Micromonospora sp. HM5-17]